MQPFIALLIILAFLCGQAHHGGATGRGLDMQRPINSPQPLRAPLPQGLHVVQPRLIQGQADEQQHRELRATSSSPIPEPASQLSKSENTKLRGARTATPRHPAMVPVKRAAFRGPKGARPLVISSLAGGARILQARGFSLATGSLESQFQALAQAAAAVPQQAGTTASVGAPGQPHPAATASLGGATAAAAAAATAATAQDVEVLPTPAGKAFIHPTVLQPAPAFPATATWPDGSAAAYQTNPDLLTEIWLPVGVTAMGLHVLGQGSALNTCSVNITIAAYSYEAPQVPAVLTQAVDSCGVSGPLGAFFGFAVNDASSDELVKLVVSVTRGVAPREAGAGDETGLPPPSPPVAGVMFSNLLVSTNRPTNPSVLNPNQHELYLGDVLGFAPLYPSQTLASGRSVVSLPTTLGPISLNRPARIQAAPAGDWPGSDATVLVSSGLAPVSLRLPKGTTAVYLVVGVQDPCKGLATAKVIVRAYTSVAPGQSSSAKLEVALSPDPAACTPGQAAGSRSVGFFMDGLVPGDAISHLEVSVWTGGALGRVAPRIMLGDLRVSKEPRATGDLLRLVPTPREGGISRVDILRQGRWGSVCGTDWSNSAAAITCRQSGFNGGSAVRVEGPLEAGPIWLKGVQCSGPETSLSNCTFTVLTNPDAGFDEGCSQDMVGGVMCHNDDLLSFVGGGHEPDFLESQLGFQLSQIGLSLLTGLSGPLNSIAAPSGPISFSMPVTPGTLSAPLRLPDGTSQVVQLNSGDTASDNGTEWLTIDLPAGTKAFGFYIAPGACIVGDGASDNTPLTALLEIEARVGLRNLSYPWSDLGDMPGCDTTPSDAARVRDVGVYVGMYVMNPALDVITQLRVKLPKFNDGTPLSLIMGGLQISSFHPLQNRFPEPSSDDGATALAAASIGKLQQFAKEAQISTAAAKAGARPARSRIDSIIPPLPVESIATRTIEALLGASSRGPSGGTAAATAADIVELDATADKGIHDKEVHGETLTASDAWKDKLLALEGTLNQNVLPKPGRH